MGDVSKTDWTDYGAAEGKDGAAAPAVAVETSATPEIVAPVDGITPV